MIIRCALILRIAAEDAGLPVRDLVADKRDEPTALARHRAFYLARTLRADLSLPQIGRHMGGRDHTTVLHGVRRIAERVVNDTDGEARRMERLRARLVLAASMDVPTNDLVSALDAAIEAAEFRLAAVREARAKIAEGF
ncbi:helix-turn-helix domain-containing protein [Phenylobacterium sp.]|uniref:helix-turn-helix domain-containing protein n=1 Tax=Phenylobacterium sp. TaxID=1871053 RepID=UPI0035B13799